MNQNIWLNNPAGRWLDAFPVGNGKIGGMVFGGVHFERIGLNHENLWRGKTKNRTTSLKHQHLEEVRKLLFEKKWIEAKKLATKHFSGAHQTVQPYQPAGDLKMRFVSEGKESNYKRTLNLEKGVVEIEYEVGDVKYKREIFAETKNDLIVFRMSADKPESISAEIELSRIDDPECSIKPWVENDRIGYEGTFDEGIEFAVEARVKTKGGKITAKGNASVSVESADEVTIYLTMATNYNYTEPLEWCATHLDRIEYDYEKIKEQHIFEYSSLYNRVSVNFGNIQSAESLPMDLRLKRIRKGEDDPGIVALYFQFGRYLLISCSRNCDQPSNLQGIWNEELRPPWDSDFHHDVNIQMCYWPAEVCNLAECIEPFLKYVWRAVPEAKKASRNLYNCRGILLPIQTDVWDRATPESPDWDVWTGAAGWIAEHFWWRYEYSLDLDFLKHQAYPFMKLVAEFYEDYLVEDEHGWLVTAPSQSPENHFVGGPYPVSLCVGSTMDLLLIRETMLRCVMASEILGIDENLRRKWNDILKQLAPFQVGKHGQLQEWLEDFEEQEPGHRHFSHLIGVFSGEQMTPDYIPGISADAEGKFSKASRKSLERRLSFGGGHTGWSRAWTSCLWSRLKEGGLAYEHMLHLITDFGTNSLLDLHPPQIFQIEGNLGGSSAIAEMLLQSHGNVIRLLPALPPQWKKGHANGLKARAGFTVDIEWNNAKIISAKITSHLGQLCKIGLEGRKFEIKSGNQIIKATPDKYGNVEFPTNAGEVIAIIEV